MNTGSYLVQTSDRDTVYGRAHERRREGDLRGAIRLMYSLLERDTSDGDVLRDLACLLAETDQVSRAERTFRHALKLHPDDAHLRVNYGVFLAQTGSHEQAQVLLGKQSAHFSDELTRALDQDDDEVVHEALETLALVDMSLARSYCFTEDPDKALEHLVPYLTHPEWWQAADELACCCAGDEDDDELELAEALLAAKKASPLMVWKLAERTAKDSDDLAAVARVITDAAGYLVAGLLAEVVEEYDHAAGLKDACATELGRRARTGDSEAAELLALFTAVLERPEEDELCEECRAELDAQSPGERDDPA